jgi:hypothetical protein
LKEKLHLLTFSSKGYSNPERFLNQATQSGFFETVSVFSNDDIAQLVRAKHLHFLIWKKRGFGFWIWKPRVILKKLGTIPESEYLVYLDQGFHINASGALVLDGYIAELQKSNSWIGVFSAGEHYGPELYVRKQAVEKHNPSFYQNDFGEYVYAGILIIKNTAQARAAIGEWQQMCETAPIWAPIPLRIFQRKEFIGQDGDNGYLPVVLDKWGGYKKFHSKEVSLINSEGFQLHHVLPATDYEHLDWSSMNNKPFVLKRDR